MTGGTAYTLNYHAKIDGKFRIGVYALLTFKDESGKVAGSYKGIHNKKSMLGNDSMKASLFFQADAIVYSVTGSRMYAEKAKTRMLWMLNDFCQGVESWLITCLRSRWERPVWSRSGRTDSFRSGNLVSHSLRMPAYLRRRNIVRCWHVSTTCFGI